MLAALQEDVDDATALRQKTEITADALQAKACAAEERVTRLERENKETADRLHRQVSRICKQEDSKLTYLHHGLMRPAAC